MSYVFRLAAAATQVYRGDNFVAFTLKDQTYAGKDPESGQARYRDHYYRCNVNLPSLLDRKVIQELEDGQALEVYGESVEIGKPREMNNGETRQDLIVRVSDVRRVTSFVPRPRDEEAGAAHDSDDPFADEVSPPTNAAPTNPRARGTATAPAATAPAAAQRTSSPRGGTATQTRTPARTGGRQPAPPTPDEEEYFNPLEDSFPER